MVSASTLVEYSLSMSAQSDISSLGYPHFLAVVWATTTSPTLLRTQRKASGRHFMILKRTTSVDLLCSKWQPTTQVSGAQLTATRSCSGSAGNVVQMLLFSLCIGSHSASVLNRIRNTSIRQWLLTLMTLQYSQQMQFIQLQLIQLVSHNHFTSLLSLTKFQLKGANAKASQTRCSAGAIYVMGKMKIQMGLWDSQHVMVNCQIRQKMRQTRKLSCDRYF